MRRIDRRTFAGPMVGAALWVAGGCGGGGSAPPVEGSKVEATVTGTVRINGAPASEGDIIFNPANPARVDAPQARASIGKDGKYSVTTLIGGNEVTLGGAVAKKNPILQRQRREVDVKAGSNSIDVEFGSAPAPATAPTPSK